MHSTIKSLRLFLVGAVALGAVTAAADSSPTAAADRSSTAKADKDMAAVLAALDKLGPKPLETLTPEQARSQPTPADAVKKVLTKKLGHAPKPEAVASIEDRTIEAADGKAQNAIRIYTPKGKGPFPVVLYFHGGGWVIADLDTYDASARALANASRAIVVSADYRHAPEHKFPAAHDDAFAAYRWTLDNIASFQGDPERVAVAGESAGGNLAINVALKARDEKLTMPRHMLLVYPVAGNDTTTESYRANADAKPLGKPGMEWFIKQVFTKPGDASDPRINLVARTDLAGLPSATVITAEIDPLRSEGRALAKNLADAGVKVHAVDYKGVTHEFFGMGAAVKKAKTAVAVAGADLSRALRTGAPVARR